MVTFEEAREIVRGHRASEFSAAADFQVAEWGFEAEEFWIIISGAWPGLYGYRDEDDAKYISCGDGPRCQVDKTTGEYTEHYGERNCGQPVTKVGVEPPKVPRPVTE